MQINLSVHAQNNVGIGTNTPDASSILELLSTNKGLLVPRMNTAGMTAIPSPANSLLVYNTDSMCYFFYRLPGLTWVSLCESGSGSNSVNTHIDSLFANFINVDSLFAGYANIDSLFANYINVNNLFANYAGIDSLFAGYANIDSLFANYINVNNLNANLGNIDSLFANYITVNNLNANFANIDSLFANYINVNYLNANLANIDSLFANYINVNNLNANLANIDSLFANYINVNYLNANLANIDSLFANYINADSLFANYANFDSLDVNGVSIQNLMCSSASNNYVTKFTSPVSICNSIIYDDGTNVGIGTNTPNYKLHVNGKIKTDDINETSDIRLKRDIVTIDNSLSKVKQLRGVYFNWRCDEFKDRNFDTSRQMGVIAQEIERIFPMLVDTDADGFKSVEYSKLVAALIEAIKEQQEQISALEKARNNQQITNKELSEKYDFLMNALLQKGIINGEWKQESSIKTK